MDINKYILGQIKIDEKLMKMVDIQENTPTKVIKKDPKQQPNSFLLNKINEDIKNQSRLNNHYKDTPTKVIKKNPPPNSFLLDKINEDIKNQSRLTNHYKSIATGKPVINEDDNIRLINSNQSLDSNLENQFNFLMSKYVKDQSQLTNLLNGLLPNMLAELVHNWAMYEPQIRQFRGQNVDNSVFGDKLRNMLLKNVNLKYPATIPLNSVMDSSNEPDIVMQKAFEAKNKNVNQQYSTSDPLFGKLDFIMKALGKDEEDCSEKYELWDVVIEYFKGAFTEISESDTYEDIIRTFEKASKYYIKEDPTSVKNMLDSLINVFTGTYYSNLNPTPDIRKLITNSLTGGSFRTKIINMVHNKYEEIYNKFQNKTYFEKHIVQDFNESKFEFSIKTHESLKVIEIYTRMSNENLIHFSKLLDTQLTDENLAGDEIPTEIVRHKRSQKDISGLIASAKRIKITKIRDNNGNLITTKDPIILKYLKDNDIKHATNPKSVGTMITSVNSAALDELYDLLLDNYHPINPDAENQLDFSDIYGNKADVVEERKEGYGLKPTEKQIHKKYFIDTHKLNNNVLEIRYNKNRHLTNVKSQVIGNGVKQIIHNILNNDSLNEKDYHVLTEHEKHLIRTILNMLEKSHLLSNADEQFNTKFQILLGQYNAGNNSEMLRNQLKQYIIHAMKLNMIGRQAGQQMLIEMSL